MKKTIPLFLMSLLCYMASQADEWCMEEDSHFYAKILGGVNFLQNTSISDNRASYNTGYIVSASVGYYLCSDFRVEAEYAYRRNRINHIHYFTEGHSKNGHFRTSSLMANLFWDIPACGFCNIQPFIGGGLGYDFQQMHSSNSRVVFHQKWRHFSWQLMAGLSYELFCNTDVTFEYRYHQGGCNFKNHTLGIGLEYNFDCF